MTVLAEPARGALEALPALPAPPDGRPIRILQITDMHFFDMHHASFAGARNTVAIEQFVAGDELTPEVGRDGRGCSYSTGRGLALLERLLDSTQPTLVVMTGDMIDGRMVSDWRSAMATILAPMQKRGIPWCFTMGNHDDDPPGAWSRDELIEIFRMKGCATPTATSFNHTFLVGSKLRLFFFDSHGGVNTSQDGVTREAVAEYEALSATRELRAERDAGVRGLAFFHIPLAEFADPASRVLVGRISEMDAARPEGFSGRMVACPGYKEHSATGRPLVNTGLYHAMARQRNVSGCFVGHDHYHDAVLKRADAGPYLAWGRVTSFTPPADFEGLMPLPFKRGARAIEVQQQAGAGPAEICTWVETVDGEEPESRIRLALDDAVALASPEERHAARPGSG